MGAINMSMDMDILAYGKYTWAWEAYGMGVQLHGCMGLSSSGKIIICVVATGWDGMGPH